MLWLIVLLCAILAAGLLAAILGYTQTFSKITCYSCHKLVSMEETSLVDVSDPQFGQGSEDLDKFQLVCLECEKKYPVSGRALDETL